MLGSIEASVYPMRSVVRMTGVGAHRLRYWEQRYGILRPERKDSGRRLYSRRDVKKIKRIAALLDRHGCDLWVVAALLNQA